MSKYLKLSALLAFLGFNTMLNATGFGISSIPAELLKDANSVVRYKNVSVIISSNYEITETYAWAITVFNAAGNAHVNPRSSFSSSEKIASVSGFVYDENGKEIRQFKPKDAKDVSAVSSMSIFVDDRVIFFDYSPTSYPYTFEFKVVRKGSNTAFIPSWSPIENEFQSVIKSSYELIYPPEWRLQTSEYNFTAFDVQKEETPGRYSLSASHLPAIQTEYLSPSFEIYLPLARTSLNHFKLEGVVGYAENWEDFGSWYRNNLLDETDFVPESTKNEVLKLIEGVTDSVKIARLIFEYVQAKTRYVSVSIGIGGWKPMSVESVAKTGYGDCKALSYFTARLLRMAGLPAYYTIVYAGTRARNIDSTQVAIQGNHVIVCVPLSDTTIWLETTSHSVPFGYLGTNTDNRYVLCLSEDGAYILKTLDYPDSLNLQETSATVALKADGSFSAEILMKSEGTQYGLKDWLTEVKSEEKDKHYQHYWDYFQGLKLDEVKINADRKLINFHEEVKLEALAYGSLTGNRMLVTANFFNRSQHVPPRHTDRKYPLEIQRGYLDKDAYVIKIPEGFGLEVIPDAVFIENQFGYYKLSVEVSDEQTIIVNREILVRRGFFPPDLYQEYYDFRRVIQRHDQSKFILIKK